MKIDLNKGSKNITDGKWNFAAQHLHACEMCITILL